MPVRRRKDKKRDGISDFAYALLRDLPAPLDDENPFERTFIAFDTGLDPASRLAVLWAEHRDDVMSEWIAEHPGTRPHCWWLFDAPRMAAGTFPGCFVDGKLAEPRMRIGGVGTPAYEVLAYVPSFALGIPKTWVDQWSVKYYTCMAKDIHGNPIGTEFASNNFKGVAIDPDDPPLYEPQASYLKHHKLFAPGEERRVPKSGWQPEAVTSS